MLITVRKAKPDDLDWLISELKKFSAFFGSKHQLFGDEEYARTGLLGMIEQHFVLIAESQDIGPVGLIGGLITPHMFNPKIRVLAETFWWVAEEHRQSRAGAMLLQEFIGWGRRNADWITFSLEAKSPVNEETLLRRGFVLQERSYVLEIMG